MRLQHIGIRPVHEIVLIDFKKKIWEEVDTGRRWNERMLKSGCGQYVRSFQYLYECLYCPTCKEYFNIEQWREDDD